MALEKAVVNMDSTFELRMAYVALSWLKSVTGLKVASRVGLDALQGLGRFGGYSRVVRALMEAVFGRSTAAEVVELR